MTIEIAKIEPATFAGGTSVNWKREDLSDYPASTWTLIYYFKGPTEKTVTATQDGSTENFTISITPAASDPWNEGRYQWVARVNDGTDYYDIDSGTLEVTKNFADADAVFDSRSFNRITRDNLRAVIQKQATKSQLAYSIAGRSIQKIPPGELVRLLDQFESKVNNEEALEKQKRGDGTGTKVKVRFV